MSKIGDSDDCSECGWREPHHRRDCRTWAEQLATERDAMRQHIDDLSIVLEHVDRDRDRLRAVVEDVRACVQYSLQQRSARGSLLRAIMRALAALDAQEGEG